MSKPLPFLRLSSLTTLLLTVVVFLLQSSVFTAVTLLRSRGRKQRLKAASLIGLANLCYCSLQSKLARETLISEILHTK